MAGSGLDRLAHDVRRSGILAGSIVAAYLVVCLSPFSVDVRVRLAAVIFVLPMAAAVATADMARRGIRGLEQRMWTLFELAFASFLAAWIYRAFVVARTGGYPATGSFEDLAILVGFLLLIPAAIILSGGAKLTPMQWLRGILDMAATLLLVGALSYWLIFIPLRSGQAGAVVPRDVAVMMYPLLAIGLVAFIAGFSRARRTPWGLLLLGGLGVGAIAAIAIGIALGGPIGYVAGTPSTAMADAVIMCAFALFALAGVARQDPTYADAPTPPPLGDAPALTGVAVSLLGLGGVPLLVWLAISAPTTVSSMFFGFMASTLAVLLIGRNITVILENAKLTEAPLAAQRYQAVIESSPVAIVVMDLDGRVLFANEACVRLMEADSAHDLIGRNRLEFVDPDSDDPVVEAVVMGFAREVGRAPAEHPAAPLPVTGPARTLKGTRVWVERTLRQISYEGNPAVLLQLVDVSAKIAAERASEAYQARLGALAADLLATEERDGRRFAEALHDDVSQPLALARINLKAGAADGSVEGHYAHEALRFVEMAIARARSLTSQMSPPLLDDLGLRKALEWLGEEFERTYSLHVTITGDVDERALDEEANSALLRTTRELLHNVVKHACVDRAEVHLEQADGFVSVTVSDEGTGLPSELDVSATSQGFGLLSIQERLPRLGGDFEIGPGPHGGVRATARLPLEPSPAR